ncbi:MAG: hypothetical protein WC588_00930 [Candidatus Micrarchaeia archaeon]
MEPKKTILLQRREISGDEEIISLCRMMRLMSERDTDATLPQVLKIMLVHSRTEPVGGSELAKISGLNRITILHHLKRLEGAGFVVRKESGYVMRVQSAEEMLLEFRKEMEESFLQMDELAREIDRRFEGFGNGISVRKVRQLRK